jgi:hypothetical protein
MSKFYNPVEIKISSMDLIKILTAHMNAEIFRDEHQVQEITMHIKGNYACTMVVDPVMHRVEKDKAVAGDKEDKKS